MKALMYRNAWIFILLLGMATSCAPTKTNPLPSWNNTPEKEKIIDFVTNKVPQIPVNDRIAVFDMDGTLACEAPLWFEMYSAVQGLCLQADKDSSLLQNPMYRYAEKLRVNPKDTSVMNHWGPSIQPMIMNAFKGWDNEKYVKFTKAYLDTAMNRDYHIPLAKMFYPPMLELISYLKANQFDVYVVSGSLQGLMWSVCPKALGFDRSHLLGTSQAMQPVFHTGKGTEFVLEPTIFQPSNNNNGKAINIYRHIGKAPVFAFGNTTGDWGMFRMASANPLPNISFMLNHDDAKREYEYSPWHGTPCPAWKDSMSVHGWNIVSMKDDFKVVFNQPNK